MFGQGFPPGEPDFWAGVGAVGVVEVVGVLDCVVAALVAAVLCVVDAEALAMPAAAPAVASAPATMVAPSILEMVIGSDLLGRLVGVSSIVRDVAKCSAGAA
jgi:hypothetical protein